jgi:hypothetical protein
MLLSSIFTVLSRCPVFTVRFHFSIEKSFFLIINKNKNGTNGTKFPKMRQPQGF